ITVAACRNPFGAISSRRTSRRLSTACAESEVMLTPIRPGKWPAPKPLNACAVIEVGNWGVVVVMTDHSSGLALGARRCQACGLLGRLRRATFFTRKAVPAQQERRVTNVG